jgi:hypothetical protein
MESRLRPAPSSADNTIKNERRKVSDVGHPSIGIITQRLAIPSLLLNLAFFLFNAISTNVALSSYNDPSSKAYTMDQSVITQHQQSTTVGYVPYEKVVGHLHSPKTAGTEINGELAARYERVCGHKGSVINTGQIFTGHSFHLFDFLIVRSYCSAIDRIIGTVMMRHSSMNESKRL